MGTNKTFTDRLKENATAWLMLLLVLWAFAGVIALVLVDWNSMSAASEDRLMDLWLMVGFPLVASLFYSVALMSVLRRPAWLLLGMLLGLEVYTVMSYFNS
jgi:hypothetical protein